MMRIIPILLALLVALPATAAEMPASLKKMLVRYADLPGFSCDFVQDIRFSEGGGKQFSGSLAVLRPQKFRWEYIKPYLQQYVGDGEKIWHYEPDLEQVQVLTNLDDVDPSVMRLLSGELGVKDVNFLGSKGDVMRVRIGKGPELRLALEKDGMIRYVESLDALQNRNRLSFSGWKLQAPPASLLRFTPPAGVEVIYLNQDQKR